MADFDERYYREIWGTVHRHDYCADLAQQLILRYGLVRFLDVGSGCGYLVKCLQALGAEAQGIEISDYALANRCTPSLVRGDIRNIPFAADSFDVVHSQGVWGYFPEADIPKAVTECRRVGRIQHHNIDADDELPEHQYLLIKPRAFWDQLFQVPKVLVTCPTHEVKEYCFQQWIDNVKTLTYPNYDVLVVDNSPDTSFMNRWAAQVPMLHIDAPQEPQRMGFRICQSMALVQQHFLAGNYAYWMNIEADNIPPKNVIEVLLSYGQGADWTSHCYPAFPGCETLQQGIGCSLLSRRLMTDFDWSKADDSPDAELWNFAQPIRSSGKYLTVELWGIMSVEHLK